MTLKGCETASDRCDCDGCVSGGSGEVTRRFDSTDLVGWFNPKDKDNVSLTGTKLTHAQRTPQPSTAKYSDAMQFHDHSIL